MTFFQIVDDFNYPSWEPAWLFQVVEHEVQTDWKCNVFSSGNLVIGPEFIARDEQAYTDMVELAAEQVDRFWSRIDSLKAAGARSKD